jgi:hypothetical protein
MNRTTVSAYSGCDATAITIPVLVMGQLAASYAWLTAECRATRSPYRAGQRVGRTREFWLIQTVRTVQFRWLGSPSTGDLGMRGTATG